MRADNEGSSKAEVRTDAKTDIRISTTKRMIKEKLRVLLKDGNIEDITIKRLCEQTGISRTTFYRHYESIEYIILDIEMECIDRLYSIVKSIKNADTELILKELFRSIQSDPDYLKIAYSDGNRFNEMIEKELYPFVQAQMAERWSGKTQEEKKIIFRFIVCGINGIIKDWIDSEYKLDTELIARTVKSINF